MKRIEVTIKGCIDCPYRQYDECNYEYCSYGDTPKELYESPANYAFGSRDFHDKLKQNNEYTPDWCPLLTELK
jgi:hypothetical protein